MSLSPPQPARCRPALGAIVLLAALALGGCMTKTAGDTTGSLGALSTPVGTDEELRAQAEALGTRYEANPNDPAAALAYARVLRARKQTAQAVAVLQQAALRNPSDLPLLAAYGKVLADAGQYRDAAEVLARAQRPDRPDWRILNVQGAVADQLGDFAGAQRHYEDALQIAPGEPAILSNQGLSFALARRLDQAETILAAAARHPNADARVRQNLALVLGLKGKLGEAEATLKRDMPPAQVAESMTAIRRMVSQTNSWKAIRQADTAKPVDTPAPPPGRQAALAAD